MLPCLKHWRIFELWQCLGDLSSGILLRFNLRRILELHQCWGILVLCVIHSCRMLNCRSSLFVARGGGYLGSGGITMNCWIFEALVLGQLGLLSGVSAPVAVLTGVVTPPLVRRTEATVWMALSLSLDNIFQSYDVDEFGGCLVGFLTWWQQIGKGKEVFHEWVYLNLCIIFSDMFWSAFNFGDVFWNIFIF